MNREKAIRQLEVLRYFGKDVRLAADGWDSDWKTLIAILMSARTRDKKTIPTAEKLFSEFSDLTMLANANIKSIMAAIRDVNYYKTKARNISKLAKILVEKYNGNVPFEFDRLVELPGIGRKSANVFLAVKGFSNIGVDTHLSYVSRKLGWTKNHKPEKIEEDLKNLFPKNLWRELNWIVVRFGQSYTNKKEKDRILREIRCLECDLDYMV
ncbi:MAG: endonuclease III [Candidatus Pacearchaeota archaeon]|nr:endonuclease III [Candidatus Pacearchaeota archaeon]